MRRGGDSRGSSYTRRNRKRWMLAKFGDGRRCLCAMCAVALDYQTVEADRIVPGVYGGRYVRSNIRPACRSCNGRQGGEIRWRAAA